MPFETSASRTEAMKEMKKKLSKLETEQGRLAGLSLKPKPDDILLVTPPKCGTTWIGQILHSLRSGGDMAFEELNLEIPCLEMAYDSGLTNIDVPQSASPRVFKTHSWYPHCPKGCRYIFVTRNPLDAGPSFYHFMSGWFLDPCEICLDDFLEELFLARGEPGSIMNNASHWHNMASWYPYRADPNVLWLHYEDLLEDLPACVALVARFIGVGENDPELQALAVKQASIDHMKQFPTKYDEHHLKLARNEACGLPRDAGLGDQGTGKVRQGGENHGDRQRMSEAIVDRFKAKWIEVMVPVTGYKSYEEMRRGINEELKRPF